MYNKLNEYPKGIAVWSIPTSLCTTVVSHKHKHNTVYSKEELIFGLPGLDTLVLNQILPFILILANCVSGTADSVYIISMRGYHKRNLLRT
jgi:hypothetical protein